MAPGSPGRAVRSLAQDGDGARRGREWSERSTLVGAALLLLVLPTALSGCIADVGSAEPDAGAATDPSNGGAVTHIEDAEGDAREQSTADLARQGRRCGWLGDTHGTACAEAVYPLLGSVPDTGGVPAPASLDITGITLTETPSDLVVKLEIAELDEAWSGVDDPGPATFTEFNVCWSQDAWETGGECTIFRVNDVNGVLRTDALHIRVSGSCNDWWWCPTAVSAEVEYGRPGAITWTVPRTILPRADQGDALRDVMATVERFELNRGNVRWAASDPVGEAGSVPLTSRGDEIDRTYDTAPDRTFVFELSPAPATPAPAGRFSMEAQAADAHDALGPRPDLDIIHVAVVEDPTSITFATQLARVDGEPSQYGELYLDFSLPDGRVHGGGTYVEDGRYRTYASEYSPGSDRTYPIEVAVHPGTPGWLNLTFPRSELRSAEAGARFYLVSLSTWGGEPWVSEAGEVGPVLLKGWVGHGVDWAPNLPPFWLAHDTALQPFVAEGGVAFDAPVGDTDPPPGFVGAPESQFDINHVAATSRRPGETLLTIGVEDLSSISVPHGYRGVLYAAALETSDGAVMAGYYKGEGQTGFFCAPDTTVFPAQKRDPNEGAMRPIEGMLPPPSSGSSDTPGSMIVFLPHTCIHPDGPARLDVARLGAGTYLIGGPLPDQPVEPVDEVRHDEPFVLHAFERDTLGQAAWYESPLGVSNFWDIAGLIFAATLAIGGLLLVRRRRRALSLYLARVKDAKAIAEPGEREAALRLLRDQLHDDLLRGRISEGHYAVVERSVETALSRARFEVFGQSFTELPHGLVVRLERMLADGTLSMDDYDLFDALLDRAQVARPVKTRVRAKLQTWLAEDVASADTPAHDLVRR